MRAGHSAPRYGPACGEEGHRVAALDEGADDYLVNCRSAKARWH